MPTVKKQQINSVTIHKLICIVCCVFIYTLSFQSIYAQKADYFIESNRYSFIDFDKNTFRQTENNPEFLAFYDKIDSLIRFGDRKINIVHIGGSHIQADIYTNQMRKRLTQLSPDMNAGRGLIFPAKMAQTNNPSNFSVKYTGTWQYSKCTKAGNDSLFGLTGFSVTTSDSVCSITIDPNRDSLTNYSFNKARIFHEPTYYQIQLKTSDSVYTGIYNENYGYTEFLLNSDQNIFSLEIKKDSLNDHFTLTGISIDNDSPGIIYNSMGVNGAMLSSYLRCNLLPKHLKAISPDLVVFSIGTNEGNTANFDSIAYINNYTELLNRVKANLPNAAVLLTVPNDCYFHKRVANKNTSVIRSIIYTIANKNNCGIWDFYEVMGGFNSAQTWYSNHLMNADRIHFNREGYILKGDLLFSAFLRSWEYHIENNTNAGIEENPLVMHAQTDIQ